MWNSIKNITGAVVDLTVVAAKEARHQIASASECTDSATRKIAWKASQIRKDYEDRLAKRQSAGKRLMIEYAQENKDK